MKVSFVNKELIDLTAITTFGISVKETENPFGYFGTGFKYAIAILLREKQKITLFRGQEKYVFSYISKEVRGKPFDIVTMNGIELGFTLDLGKNWELWQAFREIYCNTIDENGYVDTIDHEPIENITLIEIEGEDFYNIYLQKSNIILESTPKFNFKHFNIHSSQGDHIYFKTIRVADMELPGYFTYDFKDTIKLTEDRTISNVHICNYLIREEVISGTNEDFIYQFATVPRDTFEAKLDMDWNNTPSETFMRVLNSINFKNITNQTLINVFNKRNKDTKKPAILEMNNIEIKQLNKAIKFGYDILGYKFNKYTINVSDELSEKVLGMVYENEIYLSRRIFQQGTKQVTATLLEEYLHIDKNYVDETYEFQTFLFDLIIGLGEQLKGDPL